MVNSEELISATEYLTL